MKHIVWGSRAGGYGVLGCCHVLYQGCASRMTDHKAPFCSLLCCLLFVAPDDLCIVGVADVVDHLFVVQQRSIGH